MSNIDEKNICDWLGIDTQLTWYRYPVDLLISFKIQLELNEMKRALELTVWEKQGFQKSAAKREIQDTGISGSCKTP